MVERYAFGAGCVRQLALALRVCSESLKSVELGGNEFWEEDENFTEIIEALSERHQLEKLVLYQFIRALPEVFEPAPAAGGEKRKRGDS